MVSYPGQASAGTALGDASRYRGFVSQRPEAGSPPIAPSASAIDVGEQLRTVTLMCPPAGSCDTAATALADSVPCGPAWPRV